MTQHRVTPPASVEWPTLLLLVGCTGAWALLTAGAETLGWLAVPLVALTLTLHSSLQHEVLHGHPTPWQSLNVALVFPAPGLAVPYERFRDQHLAHHRDASLTDPYDDPESHYLDPAVWEGLPRTAQVLLLVNNTLAGRMLLGPALSLACFWRAEARAALRGDRAVLRAWGLHALGLVPVALWLGSQGTMGAGAYLAACYLSQSVLKIRTFLEHRAHEAARGRSVIIEDRGPLAFLFLNNNLHAVHHGAPGVAWYRLPAHYRARRERFLTMNDGYEYGSYAEVFARHFLRRKDPVAHPLWRPTAE